MKILLVSHYLLPHSGGIEVLVDREARLLAGAGHEVVLLGSDAGAGAAPPYPEGVRICRAAAWNGLERRFQVPWPVFSPAVVPAVWRGVRWCDIVHAHGLLYLNSFLALLFARALGKPTVLTEHIGLAWYPPGLRRALQRAAMELIGRASARLAGRCIGYHERVVALLRRLAGPRRSASHVPNPLDRTLFRPPADGERRKAREELGWEKGRPKVLFVGRLIHRKGIDLLLRAADPRYDLVFCGRGDPSLLGEVRGDGVTHLPPRPQKELVRLYHAADVLAHPSRSEGGLVLVAQEALACGLPVLLGEDPGLAHYRGCAGLCFCALTPEAVRRGLLEILERRQVPVIAGPGEVPLQEFLPDEEAWLEELYGRRAVATPTTPLGSLARARAPWQRSPKAACGRRGP